MMDKRETPSWEKLFWHYKLVCGITFVSFLWFLERTLNIARSFLKQFLMQDDFLMKM